MDIHTVRVTVSIFRVLEKSYVIYIDDESKEE